MQNATGFLNRIVVAFLIVLVFGLNACSSAPKQPDRLIANLEVPDSTSLVEEGDIRLGPLDLLQINVFGVPELSGEYQIDSSGHIRVPLIGELMAKGFTSSELSTVLERSLGERYLQDPNVSVVVKESFAQMITVDGAVTKPGMYPVQGPLTLLQAVAMSGGPTEGAKPESVIVFRQIEGQRMAAAFNLNDIRAGVAEDPSVFGNDIIVVDGSEAKQRYGDFLKSVPLLTMLFIAF